MKLKFSKNESGEVFLLVDGKPFSTEHYLEMVRNIKDKTKIELDDFGDNIAQEEKDSINKMIADINKIEFMNVSDENEDSIGSNTDNSEEPDDLPF